MKKTAASLGLLFLFMAHFALAADDGQTQPKVNTASSNSHTTATDLIATTNASGNVKGVTCKLTQDGSGNFPAALVKFYVDSGSAQSVTLTSDYMLPSGNGPYADGYTGWVPLQCSLHEQHSHYDSKGRVEWSTDRLRSKLGTRLTLRRNSLRVMS